MEKENRSVVLLFRFSDISASFFLTVGQIVVEALVTPNLLFNSGYQNY